MTGLRRGSALSDLGSAANPRGSDPDERVDPLVSSGAFRLERIVSRGHASPPGFWYDQSETEWVLVLRGEARLEIEGHGEIHLTPGDWVELPAHRRHRVGWTSPDRPTVWVALFYPP